MKYRNYLFTYTFDQKDWSISISARSEAEALEKIKAVGGARYTGILQREVSALNLLDRMRGLPMPK